MVLCPDSELNCPVTGTGNTIFWTVAHTLTARYTHLPQNTFVVAHPEIKFMTINDLATVVPQASFPGLRCLKYFKYEGEGLGDFSTCGDVRWTAGRHTRSDTQSIIHE